MARLSLSTNHGKKFFSLLIASCLSIYSFSQTSIFSSSSVPTNVAETDGTPIETGVKFRVTQAGYITGIRFYKGALNTGTHIGHLWSSTGTKLAEVIFAGESASGWQQMLFTTPVAVAVNTTYVASYFSSSGYYAYTNPFFTTATVNGPLTALANGTDGSNGVYIYSAASAFPVNNYQTSNYWVDIVYATSIGPDLTAPIVSITAPVAGNVSGTVNVTATATDNVGVVGVQFQLNGVNLATEDLTSPYSISWNTSTSANGGYTLTAIARDAAGNTTTSAPVAITINNDTIAPTVSLTGPGAGPVTGTISLTATAADNVGVAGVQFLLDGANLGTEDVTTPYSISWNTAAATNGTHTLSAKARDAAGNTTISSPVVITVTNAADTQPPVVNITAPTGGTVSGSVTLTANATDNVAVVGVQFLLNGVNLGTEDLASPYSISWSTATVVNGNYTLTAKARDIAGNVTTSAPVNVTVSNTTLIAALGMNEGTGTTTADISGNNHSGTLTSGPVWGAGKYGQGLTLNGTSSYVNIADHNDFTLDPAQSYTWSAWVKNTTFKEWSTVWSQTMNNSNFFYFYAHTSTDADGGPVTNGISVYWWTGNNRLGAHSANNVLTAGQWSYVTVTYDASQLQNNRFSVYVNGVDVTVRTDVSSAGTLASINPTNIRIGSNQPFGEYLNGSVDEVRFYKRLLTLSEVQADMVTPISPDNIAPTINITAPAAGPITGAINVTANASDNVGIVGVQFLLDGVNLGSEDLTSPYSVSWNTATATNENHTLTARARDAVGNVTTSAGVVVSVDTQSPAISITSPASGVVRGTINVDANATDNIGIAGVQFILDGVNFGNEVVTAPYSVAWNTTNVTDGNHTLTATARDAAGNLTLSSPVVVIVNNDVVPPLVIITSPLSGNVSGTINVTATASDNVGIVSVQFQLNGVNLGVTDSTAPYGISLNTSTIANGNYGLTAKAIDAAGNMAVSDTVFVTVANDNEAPLISLTAPTTDTVAGTINIAATASDNVGVVGVQFLLDGVALGAEDLTDPYSISWNTTTVADSNHTLTARARDAAGNITVSAIKVVTVHNDSQAPLVTITSPATGNVSGTINVTANASDNTGVIGVQFLLDGINLGTEDLVSPYTISWNTTAVANGSYTLTARARDASGNVTTSAGVAVSVDTQSPAISITSPASGVVRGTINVDANATDNIGIAGVQFILDGVNFGNEVVTAPYSVAWNTTNVTDGNHTLTATARDAAGNLTLSSPVVVIVNNDVVPPLVIITSPLSGNVSGTINVTATASDNVGVVSVQFQLNGVNLGVTDSTAPYGISLNTSTIANGNYGLTAKAIDAAGNMAVSDTVFVTVANDNEAPLISLTAPTTDTVAGTINIAATASDNVAVVGVQFLLDGVALGAEDLTDPYSISWNTTTVADSNHTLTARARDAAGNITVSAIKVVTVHNDSQAPLVTITSPATGNVSGTINVTANASDNTGVIGVQFLLDGINLGTEDLVSPYTISWNTTTVANGSYTLTARARDASGNVTTSAGIDVTVNNNLLAPAVTITSPAAGPVSGTVSVNATTSNILLVVSVQFQLNGNNLGAADFTAPYGISLNTSTIANGNYGLTAKAIDLLGNVTISDTVFVTVANDNEAPLISLTAPTTDTVAGTINIAATASDNVAVVGVQFLLDGVALGAEDLTDPYSISWNTTTVADSNHTLTARARDAAGNITVSAIKVVTVHNDSQAPLVTITSPATGNVSGTINVTANASDNTGVIGVQFLLDGINLGTEDLVSPYTISWNTTTVANGSYTLTAKARDASGNITTSVGTDVTVNNDTQAPTVTITAPVAGNVSGTISITAAASDNVGVVGVQFLLGGVNLGSEDLASPYTTSWNTTTMTNGNYTLTAKARDAAGNVTISLGVLVTVNNDTQAPTVAITAPAAGNVSGTVSITAAAGDNVGVVGVQFLLDGVNLGSEDLASPYTTSWNTTTMTNGNYTLTAKARDAAGNVTISPGVLVTVNNDTQAPTVTITAPAAGNVSGTISVTATAGDNVGVVGVQFLLGGVNLGSEDLASPYTTSWNTTTMTNGNYTLTAKARDAAGNVTISPGVLVTVNNDTQAPTVAITAPAAGNVSGTVSITATAGDNVGVVGVQFLLDGVNLGSEDLASPYTTSWNTTTMTNGNYTLTAKARDAAGNVTISPGVLVTVNNDTQAPTVTITAPAAGNVSGTVSITATAGDNVGVVGVQFLLDGANLGSEDLVVPYTTSWNTTTVTNGNHTLTAKARDAAGNITTSAGIVVTVNNDTQVPTITITAPAAGSVSGTINVTASAADNVGVIGVQFLLDGINLGSEDLGSPYSLSWNTTTVADGSHTLTARARDAAGNTTTSVAVIVSVLNDTQSPTVTISAPAAGNVSGTVTVSATAGDNVGVEGVQFLLNGVNLSAEDTTAPYSISWNTASAANGAYTLTATARDAAGNTATSSPVNVIVANAANLIAAINLNEGTGTAASDVSGNNHNGTLTGSPAWVAGKYGQAVSLNGVSNYVNIPAHADFALNPAQSYTWSAWVKNTNFAEWGPVWSQTVDVNNFFYFYAHTSTDADGGPVTKGISVYWWNSGGTNKVAAHSSNNVLTAGQWSYVTVVYDASQPQNNRFTIYVNGADVTVRTDVVSKGTITAINSTNIRIGSDQPFSESLNGAIDEVRVYKKALTSTEIATDMNTPIASGIVPNVTPLNGASNVSLSTALTAVFNLDMTASTINASNFELRDANNALIPATVEYSSSTRTATLTPTSLLLGSSQYTAKIKGGASGIKDAAGNTMTNDYVWSFTTLDPQSLPITEGPGGPILVVSTTSNPFSRYAVEILRSEGLNEFAAADISSVTSTMLNNYDVVILGEMTVNASQVTMFTNWVNAGGTLIAFKPSSLLTPLMGLSSAGSTLSDKYLLVNTASGPGAGIVSQTIQFHGSANLHTLNGATSLATLYSTSSAPTTNPAVTTINVGTKGGQAVAFTYDLAKSIVYTRQGDPNKPGVETDGQSPVRPDDLFYPSYVDMNKVAIPQADEQQRLLANIIIQSNLSRKPLPRFWYLPNGYKAAVIYALDDHGTSSGTTDIFNKLAANSTAGCSVDNWECLRATSWFYVGIPLTNSQAVSYLNQGFDMGVHVQNGCNDFTSFANLDANYVSQLSTFHSAYPGLPNQIGNRFHCLVWSDWLTQAKVELSHGMRFSLDYYYWPPAWINGRPGLFTGSGMPMRFADHDGSMIDVYQGVSQLVNENGIDFSVDINTLLDNAVGSSGYYGLFATHDDYTNATYSTATITSAKAHNVPIISVKQALTWLDGRNNSSFGNLVWNNNQLSFTVTARANANNIRAMLPFNSSTGQLVSIKRNGSTVTFTTQTIKGMQYAFFAPISGTSNYVATYSSGARMMSNPVTELIPATPAATQLTQTANVGVTEGASSPSLLSVSITPNPTVGHFNLSINGGNASPATIRISDMFGRLIETKTTTAGVIKLGANWVAGTYIAEVVQGDQRRVIKLIKTN